jgi:hypothetical protein
MIGVSFPVGGCPDKIAADMPNIVLQKWLGSKFL